MGGPGLELPVVAERIGMQEVAGDDVRVRLDVLVGMERPLGTRDDPIVVEDTEGTDAHLLRVSIPVEREVPPRVQPAALLMPDGVGFPDRDRAR